MLNKTLPSTCFSAAASVKDDVSTTELETMLLHLGTRAPLLAGVTAVMLTVFKIKVRMEMLFRAHCVCLLSIFLCERHFGTFKLSFLSSL